MTEPLSADTAIAVTRAWIERAVIGLNLCPFAGRPWREDRVRLSVSEAAGIEALAEDLGEELLRLQRADPVELETSLLIHPFVLNDFFEYNDFLDIADRLVEDMGLAGVIQVASFHPRYQFAETPADDPANFTNRSPYPMLHLLREASIEAATDSIRDPDAIYERNIRTLRELGLEGCRDLASGRTAG